MLFYRRSKVENCVKLFPRVHSFVELARETLIGGFGRVEQEEEDATKLLGKETFLSDVEP